MPITSRSAAATNTSRKRVVAMNRGIVAQGGVGILSDDEILRATYGGHRVAAPHLVADEHHA